MLSIVENLAFLLQVMSQGDSAREKLLTTMS